MRLDLPESSNEPKPWTVSVWRHHHEEREPFVVRQDAIDYAVMLEDTDCYVEGIYGPDGTFDIAATNEAMPWRKDDGRTGL